jgi:predicted ATPase/DNA-binding CsgD family transcriptional regulator
MDGIATSPDQLTERECEILECLSKGLSDQQIAAYLVLSSNTVKWYNRQIYSKLGVSNRTEAATHANSLRMPSSGAQRRDSPSAQRPPPNNLPIQTTTFIGRSRELADVTQLLRVSRLLTLTGTGGTGKTRLALRTAAEGGSEFTDGVYFVDLAPLSDHSLVAKAIAGALGVVENPTESLLTTLKRVLAHQTVLLLIDNFEHVIEAAPLVSELLAASPRLKTLITSRESLHLAGEQEYPVPPLTLPMTDADSIQSLQESEAGTLFIQRAQMTLPRFEVRDDNAPAIAQICTRLDGLPLAIELAAGRCKLLTPQALLERLEATRDGSSLHALARGSRDAPPRQRTLRDTMAWSYNLLDEGEKTLFSRLAVFRGGRSLEAIEAVCGEGLSIDVFDGLASLVDKSLVQQKEAPEGEPRFVLLEMIHEYARERLEASGETETMRRRHAEYFVALAERAEPELRLARYDDWCQLFELEMDNIRTVLEWSLSAGDVTLGARLAGALVLFWYGKGYHIEGIRWIQQLLDRLDEVPVMCHPQFLFSAGHMTFLYDLDAAHHLFRSALDISRTLGDTLHTAWALTFVGLTRMREPETAIAIAEEGLAMFRALNFQPGIAQALNIIGEIARLNGDDDRAERAYEECLAVSHETGETRRICYLRQNLALIAQHRGNHSRAIELVRQALELARARKDKHDIAEGLAILAGSVSALDDLQKPARILGASEAALERLGTFHQPADKPEYDRIVAEVRAQLDYTSFQKAWAEGRVMTLEQAVAEVLEEQNGL